MPIFLATERCSITKRGKPQANRIFGKRLLLLHLVVTMLEATDREDEKVRKKGDMTLL